LEEVAPVKEPGNDSPCYYSVGSLQYDEQQGFLIQIMAQKSRSSFRFFVVFSFVALSQLFLVQLTSVPLALAEVTCVAEVSYRWTKEQLVDAEAGVAGAKAVAKPDTRAGQPSVAASKKASDSTTSAGAAPLEPSAAVAASGPGRSAELAPGERRVRVATIERRGKDEPSAKASLLVEVNRQKARAHELCRRDHESFGDCVSTKMASKTSALNSLSFSARRKVEDALIDECRVQQGQCLVVESDEPACLKAATPVPTPAPSPEPTETETAQSETPTPVAEAAKQDAAPAATGAATPAATGAATPAATGAAAKPAKDGSATTAKPPAQKPK